MILSEECEIQIYSQRILPKSFESPCGLCPSQTPYLPVKAFYFGQSVGVGHSVRQGCSFVCEIKLKGIDSGGPAGIGEDCEAQRREEGDDNENVSLLGWGIKELAGYFPPDIVLEVI